MSYFGSIRGGELPGRWFVTALAEVGCDEAAVRQCLYRMEQSGELTSRRVGREKYYAPSSYAQAEITAGTEKIFQYPEPWDGRWTVVCAYFDRSGRMHRARLNSLLQVEGFATVYPGVHLHPQPRGERIRASLSEAAGDRVLIFRGDRVGTEPEADFIARHWNVLSLAQRYRSSLTKLSPLAVHDRKAHPDGEAFRSRFEVVLRFLKVAWDDPGLPEELLPQPWPGKEARHLAAELYRRFLPGAVRFGDRILENCSDTPKQTNSL